MKKVFAVTAALALLCLGGIAQADVFSLGPGLTNLDTVLVGDPGNEMDTDKGSGYFGSVGYTYKIGKYEVTAAQYTDFLKNKAKSDLYGLYNTNMETSTYGAKILRTGAYGSYTYSVAPDWANRPVNYVSFWDSLRFANWLHNGQGPGDTETGAYTLDGYVGEYGGWIGRNAGAKWFLPSEDEWYKAAYYKGGGISAGYWDYPTQSVTPPGNLVISPDPGNNANYIIGPIVTIGSPYWRTVVGEFENSASAYGTFDQGGNIEEWNEALGYEGYDGSARVVRGSDFWNSELGMRAATRNPYSLPWSEFWWKGFRVAEVIPEPSGLLALASGLVGLSGMMYRRRKR